MGVSTPCGTVSTRENLVFVFGLSELYRHGRVSERVRGGGGRGGGGRGGRGKGGEGRGKRVQETEARVYII